jgi:hypothetical protein
MTTAFETEVCSRCGGTGHFSFNGEHSRCYKCDNKNGARAYTKRGAAAKAYYLAKFQVPAASIVAGELVSITGVKLRVKEVKNGSRTVKINGVAQERAFVELVGEKSSFQVSPDALVRRFPTEAENEAAIQDALAYQETLTKNGTPRKQGRAQ